MKRFQKISIIAYFISSYVLSVYQVENNGASSQVIEDNTEKTFPVEKTPLSNEQINHLVEGSVVQIMVAPQIKNIFEPYRPCEQKYGWGSGFFISIEGRIYILTNAHVIDQSKQCFIHMPELGKQPIRATMKSIFHQKDLALLELDSYTVRFIEEVLGRKIPYLEFGDSTKLCRSDTVITAGYPLGQRNLKITRGIFCGKELFPPEEYLQTDAPINPGNSGGALLNIYGEVVGINALIYNDANNVGYAIPIEQFLVNKNRIMLSETVMQPMSGIVIYSSSYMAAYLGNPVPGGALIVEVFEGSPFAKAGIQPYDMIYEINGHAVDMYGDIRMDTGATRIAVSSYIHTINCLDEDISIVIYRKGERIERKLRLNEDFQLGVHMIRPGYDEIDYEIFAGMVIQPLNSNFISEVGKQIPSLLGYKSLIKASEQHLVVTHIYPSSAIDLTYTACPGFILTHVNNTCVKTLEELRTEMNKSLDQEFITMKFIDTHKGNTDKLQVALPVELVFGEERELSAQYERPITLVMKKLLEKYEENLESNQASL